MRYFMVCVLLVFFTAAVPVRAGVLIIEYANCTEVHKVYKGGIAIPGAKNVGGKTKYKPFEHRQLYEKNRKSDRDKDNIACEQ